MEPRNFASSEECVAYIKELADSIETVDIRLAPNVGIVRKGEVVAELNDCGAVLQRCNGKATAIGSKELEVLLNDGIFQRLRIPIRVVKDGDH